MKEVPMVNVDYDHAESFVAWLLGEAITAGRGDRFSRLPVEPSGRLWLGRIAPEIKVRESRLGERGERLEPCAIGLRVRLSTLDGRGVRSRATLRAWKALPASDDPDADKWEKTERVDVTVDVPTPTKVGGTTHAGRAEISAALARVGADGLEGHIQAEVELGREGPELVVTLVNVSPKELPHLDTNLYQAELYVDVGQTEDFLLEGLEDTFRYDRHIPAYGVNAGVERVAPGVFRTTDVATHDRRRLVYWDEERAGSPPTLSFAGLAADPVGPLREMVSCLDRWGARMWSEDALRERGRVEDWSSDTLDHALQEAVKAHDEAGRVRRGLEVLERDDQLRRSFSLANRAFHEAYAIRHTEWRPFQLGFVLANLPALCAGSDREEMRFVDTLWFATGGGKTETYLLYTLTAAFHDRLRGKREGITSWARFPLRMLSLDQTQRFADVLAAAELVRRAEHIEGDAFSVGFLVGKDGTPNRIDKNPRTGDADPADPHMPARYQVLLRCPFCGSEQLVMQFDSQRWALDHLCRELQCPWHGEPLPFRIVDYEIYRWLPTVVLGTLDKAANVGMQAAMRGFYGAPAGRCPKPGHGFTYAPRSDKPNGCLYPGCTGQVTRLVQESSLYPPTIRMQDELHLLRDSLGSVDSHYEALLDGLERHWGGSSKLIASSATLAGHDRQIEALYRRRGRTFPLPGPHANRSFWSKDSGRLARRYVGLAPRGVTLEFANGQLVETLQTAVRRALHEPDAVAEEAGVPREALPALVSVYGVDVVYGSTLKDVEAAARSFEAEIRIPNLNSVTLTGRTPLDEVRGALKRLKDPEPNFEDRIHLVAASSMLSHGVDIDRLNVMVMLGLPLSTAEYIQTTARVGRSYPGIVFTLHKIGRERDAAVFRIFPSFIENMDRLVDPVPITSKSRRVLELTFAGLEQARIYGIHEPAALRQGLKQLTTPGNLKRAFLKLPVTESQERSDLEELLAITGALDENLRRDLERYLRDFYRQLNNPANPARFVPQLFSTGEPMMSLRDVEEQVRVRSKGDRS
jgi:Helicase conserved C-terminal domain